MIVFRVAKQSFKVNTFFAAKGTPIAKSLNAFGYLRSINKKGLCSVYWYSNFIRVEMVFKMKELLSDYKSIYPYFNTKEMRGGIWKYSYSILLNNICPNKGFSLMKVDPITIKVNPVKGNKVEICDARYVLDNKITILEGKIVNVDINSHPSIYTIRTPESEYLMFRNYFSLVPLDNFTLLTIRCQ